MYIFTYLLIITIHPYILCIEKYYYNITIKKLTSCKINVFHCLYVATVPVHHTCTVANQVWACDTQYSLVVCVSYLCPMCHMCSLAGMHTPKLHATVHVHAKFLNFTHGKHAGTHMHPYACVKFKFSYTIFALIIGVETTVHTHVNFYRLLNN